jgi:hypothetical protein
MATVARPRLVVVGVGERLLASKLQILNGSGIRRPSMALSILTGSTPEPLPIGIDDPGGRKSERHYAARTVYLAERHLRDIDHIIGAWEQSQPGHRKLNRSAVLRRAIEHLRTLVEAESPLMLENE